jgi:hypothetical protein
MADAYYRSLYFSLNNPEDLELLGMLFALPRWRQPTAIKSALRQYLPTVLDRPALDEDEVRAFVENSGRARRRRCAPGPRLASSQPTTPQTIPGQEGSDPGPETARAKDAREGAPAEVVLENRLDQLMKSRWIG